MHFSADTIINILFRVPSVLIAISVHEFAHGYVAYKLGDPTAKQNGRLSLNPLAHMNLLGTICMLVVGFGWANPVPVNSIYFKNRKAGMSLVGLAGPLSNLILAMVISILIGIGYGTGVILGEGLLSTFLYRLLMMGLYLNLGLAVFNLIPIPPLDGSKILAVVLPDKYYYKLMEYERYVMPVLFLLLFLGVLDIPMGWAINKLLMVMQEIINLIIGWF